MTSFIARDSASARFIRIVTAEGDTVFAPRDELIANSSFVKNLLEDAALDDEVPTVPISIIGARVLRLILRLMQEAEHEQQNVLRKSTFSELLLIASGVSFLDMPPLLSVVHSVVASWLRGANTVNILRTNCEYSRSGRVLSYSQSEKSKADGEVVIWPNDASDDLFGEVIRRLGIVDSIAFLEAAASVSEAWAAGAAARQAVAIRTWAGECNLHEIAGQEGVDWFGDLAIDVLKARLAIYPAAAHRELRTHDKWCGWLPLHAAAFSARRVRNNDEMILALIEAYPEGRHVRSQAVQAGQTPFDIVSRSFATQVRRPSEASQADRVLCQLR